MITLVSTGTQTVITKDEGDEFVFRSSYEVFYCQNVYRTTLKRENNWSSTDRLVS